MKKDLGSLYFFPFELLIRLRWAALIGQITTVVVLNHFGFEMPIVKLTAILSFSILLNLIFHIFPRDRLLLNEETLPYFILFDLIQLAFLLYLTGGLFNPFVVFILGPILICASIPNSKLLTLAVIMGVLTVSFLYLTPYPLPWFQTGLIFDPVLRLGIALALITSILFYGFYVYTVNHSKSLLLEKLSLAESELEVQKHMVERGLIAAACAHELGSPLSTILLTAKELAESGEEDGRLIYEQARRCRDILRKLSSNYRESSSFPIPLRTFLRNLFDSYAPRVPLEVQDQTNGEASILPSAELSLAFSNLLHNAMEHASNMVTLQIKEKGDVIILNIKDDGDGFSKKDLSTLGEYFPKEVRPNHQGIGLFITKKIFQQKGIRLSFKNDQGACCQTEIPRSLLFT